MPGAGKQAPEIQAQIKELLEAGFDPTTIHRRLKVGRSSIYRMKRCLQQHGTAYMPTEMNKKNGRPKVLSAEQELEVREWLRDPKNRDRYLDDLVWLIHDRFGIVCSTTTMSKLKRKWIKVIEAEETGGTLDDQTRAQVKETHPNLPILNQQGPPPQANMMPPPSMQPPQIPQSEETQAGAQQPEARQVPTPSQPTQTRPQSQIQHQQYQPRPLPQRYEPPPHQQYEPLPQQQQYPPPPQQHYELPPTHQHQQFDPQIDAGLLQHTDPRLQPSPYHIGSGRYTQPPQHHLDSQLQHDLQQGMASTEGARM